MIKKSILFLIFLLSLSTAGFAQPKKSNWNNKDKGTVFTSFSAIHVYPKDTSMTGVPNTLLTSISVRLYELTPDGCKQIKGKVKINGKEYDTAGILNTEGETELVSNFSKWIPEGEYGLAIPASNEYYPIRLEKYFLSKGLAYHFDFYLVRKDALKRN